MNSLRVVMLVARREIAARLGVKSFYILTGLLMVVIVAIGVINRVADGGGTSTLTVAVVSPVPDGFTDSLRTMGDFLGREVTVQPATDAASARQAVGVGDADAAVVGGEAEVVFDEIVDVEVESIIQQAWSSARLRVSLADAGLDSGQVDDVLSPAPLASTLLDARDDDAGLALLTGTLVAVLLMVSLQTFGNYVLVGVIEEKATAVVELLLARIRSDQLLAGKVIGIGVAALLQFALAVVAGLVSLAISGVDVPSEIWSTLPTTLVWFVGGYTLYSTLFALAGSLVSRQEDAQAAAAPIITAIIAAYMVVLIFGYDPESRVSMILSLVPPVAPFMMPMRMAAGAASVSEFVLSLGLMALAIVGTWKLAGRIYDEVLLRRGTRISWGEALSIVRGH